MFIYEVTGYCQGRKVVDEVKAYNQTEARRRFNVIYPEYKAGAAKQVGRA